MDKNLADAIAEVHASKQTGVLSVSIRNDNNQLKFFFRDGAVYYVTYSSCRNLECLIRLGMLTPERAFFIPGPKVDAASPITLKTADIIGKIRSLNKTVRWGSPTGSDGDGTPPSGGIALVGVNDLTRLEEELLDMLGPVAGIVFDRACAAVGATKDTPVPTQTFHNLLRMLAQQMPDEQAKKLLAKFAF